MYLFRKVGLLAPQPSGLPALLCYSHLLVLLTLPVLFALQSRSIALLRHLCYSHLLVLLALPVLFALFALLALPALVLLALLVLLAPLAPVSIVSCFGFTLRQLRLVHLCQVKL